MAAFERDYPRDPGASTAAHLERMRHKPKEATLYPLLAASEAFEEWLMPVLRRLEWNVHRGESGARWTAELSGILRMVLPKLRRVSEAELLALASEGAEPIANRIYHLKRFATALEKAGPLSGKVVNAIRSVIAHGRRPHELATRETVFAWLYFRAEGSFAADDPCWSARVRRDLDTFDPGIRATWLRVFDVDGDYSRGGAADPTKACLKAVSQLGNPEVERGLRRWIGMLVDGPAPSLSAIGSMVFRHVIGLCDLVGGRACEELLYDIARAPWVREEDVLWIPTYLWALERRSDDDRAFACLEALVMNPVTATDEVRRKYGALLDVFGAGALPTSDIGVDGFPLDRDPALQAQQTRIDQLLRLGAGAAALGPYVHPSVRKRVEMLRSLKDPDLIAAAERWAAQLDAPRPWFDVGPEVKASLQAMENSILKEFSADPASLHLALAHRLEWIAAHQEEFSKDTAMVWGQSLRGLGCQGGLLQRSLREVDKLPRESLLSAIKAGPANLKVFELCKQHVAEHGWHGDLVEPIRKWVSTLGTSHTDNYYRAQVEWFLWFEDVAPIDMDACWSHRVKQDLRGMPAEERAAWRGLMNDGTFLVTDRPPKKWAAAAEPAFRKIGAEVFRRRIAAWFEPLAKGEPVRLTVTGRNVLRLLMWSALFAKDRAVDRVLAGFVNAKWKTKETEKRVSQAEMAFAYVLAQRAPETAFPILEEQVTSGRAFLGSSIHKTYVELCARLGRKAVKAVPITPTEKKKPQTAAMDALRLLPPLANPKPR